MGQYSSLAARYICGERRSIAITIAIVWRRPDPVLRTGTGARLSYSHVSEITNIKLLQYDTLL